MEVPNIKFHIKLSSERSADIRGQTDREVSSLLLFNRREIFYDD